MSSNSSLKNDFISLPKGGGALSGIGEKFSADTHMGTGNFSIPISVPKGRNGFQPELNINFSTGSPNGMFGLGWQLSIPRVSRKTSKGIPVFDDCKDVFVLSGMDDLVKVSFAGNISTFRPRSEGAFAEINFIQDSQNSYWEVKNKNGHRSIYGTPNSRGNDPAVVYDPDDHKRQFSWLLTKTIDTFNNSIVYRYTTSIDECNGRRLEETNLTSIDYINYSEGGTEKFLVSILFSYQTTKRPDTFSGFRSGFEIRTSLRLGNILIQNNSGATQRIKQYSFTYRTEPLTQLSLLEKVQITGFDDNNFPVPAELAPLEFEYSEFEPQKAKLIPVKGNLPPVSQKNTRLDLIDLDGNGLPDIIECDGQIRYWKNLGNGSFSDVAIMQYAPSVDTANGNFSLIDANGDGRADLMQLNPVGGFYSLEFNGQWNSSSFTPYTSLPAVDTNSANSKMIDLDGDGITDIIHTDAAIHFHFNNEDHTKAWQFSRTISRTRSDNCPDISFADPRVKTGDMNGDGLPDIIFFDGGSVVYWPNAGWGNWGKKVIMKNPPSLPPPDEMNRVLVSDINGDGLADIVLVENSQVKLWINQSGAAWSNEIIIKGTPSFANGDDVRIIDLNGTGVSGILWSSNRYYGGPHHYFYLDLSSGNKPYLLTQINNNTGAVTNITYASSSYWYLRDREEQRNWKTYLPINVLTVKTVEVIDKVSKSKLTTTYRYHHGHWDGEEREFMGFGMVEQTDSQLFSGTATEQKYFSPPVTTKTWFHVGPVRKDDSSWITADFSDEYYIKDKPILPVTEFISPIINNLPGEKQKRDALRSVRGMELRKEVFVAGNITKSSVPFSVAEYCYGLRLVNSIVNQKDVPVLFPFPVMQRNTRYEGGDDLMTQFIFSSLYDNFGQPLRKTNVAMPRRFSKRQAIKGRNYLDDLNEKRILATLTFTQYALPQNPNMHLRDCVSEIRSYSYIDSFAGYLESDENDTAAVLMDQFIQARYIDEVVFRQNSMMTEETQLELHQLNYYDGSAFRGLPLGRVGNYGVLSRSEMLVFTDKQLGDAYQNNLPATRRPAYLGGTATPVTNTPNNFGSYAQTGYFISANPVYENGYYTTSVQNQYDFQIAAGTSYGLVMQVRDARNNPTLINYDPYGLLPVKVIDVMNNETNAIHNYRVFSPLIVRDINGNINSFTYNSIGMPLSIFRQSADGIAGGTAITPDIHFDYVLQYQEATNQPISVTTLARTEHALSGNGDEYIRKTEYSDGFGRLVQTIAQTDDIRFGMTGDDSGLSIDVVGSNTRAVGDKNRSLTDRNKNTVVSGWQIYNNKGRVVEKYEPFFYTGYDFVDSAMYGQHTELYYDAIGRQIQTTHPDGSMTVTVYGTVADYNDPTMFNPSPWEQHVYDGNDLALVSFKNGISLGDRAPAIHHFTPVSVLFDGMARTLAEVRRNDRDEAEWFITTKTYDARGNVLDVFDTKKRKTFTHYYDLLSRVMRIDSIDAGKRTKIYDAIGNIIEYRDDKDSTILRIYDSLNRLVEVWAKNDSNETMLRLIESIRYGEGVSLPNLNGNVYKKYDEAGLTTFDRYDFKNNILHKTRRILIDNIIGTPVDWSRMDDTYLNATGYETNYTFDALNRITGFVYPAEVGGNRSLLTAEYNPSGKLRKVMLNAQPYVRHLAYNAKEQRLLIAYGNDRMTRYVYEPENFRLKRLRTESYTLNNSGSSIQFIPGGSVLQDFAYDYDLAGNITSIKQLGTGVGFGATPDELERIFEYDPIYRLMTSTGREMGRSTSQPDLIGLPRIPVSSAIKGYREKYEYDETGNFLFLRHRHFNFLDDWKRNFTNDNSSNRLLKISDDSGWNMTYAYDKNGNMIDEGHSRSMKWNHSDRMIEFTVHDAAKTMNSVNADYHYDSAGNRVIKKVDSGGNIVINVYIEGLFEHCIDKANGTSNNHLHIMDDQKRIAIVRTGNAMGDATPPVQYHFGDHLGSSCTIVGGTASTGNIKVSVEEYTAYGETSLGSHNKKRYRYSGKERDEESGLYYYGARYYLPWTGRWVCCDPIGIEDGINIYLFLKNNPINSIDKKGKSTDPLPDLEDLTLEELKLKDQIKTATEELPSKLAADGLEALKEHTESQKALEKQLSEIQQKIADRKALDAERKALASMQGEIDLETDPRSEALQKWEEKILNAETEADVKKALAELNDQYPTQDKTTTERLKQLAKDKLATLAEKIPAPIKKIFGGAAKAAPAVGIVVGVAFVAYNLKQGNYGEASLDAVGLVPGVGDALDAGRAGGELLNWAFEDEFDWWVNQAVAATSDHE